MLKGYTELEEHLATGVQNDVPKKGLDQKRPSNKTGSKGGTLGPYIKIGWGSRRAWVH